MFREVVDLTVFQQFLLTLLDNGLCVLAWVDILVRVLLETMNASATDRGAHVVVVITLGRVIVYLWLAGLPIVQLIMGVTAMCVRHLLIQTVLRIYH